MQDKNGYLWFAETMNIGRFNGHDLIRYANANHSSGVGGGDRIECIAVDSAGIIWIGYLAGGLESFNPETGQFFQYRHTADSSSLSIDTVAALLIDDQNQVWVGTHKGLDLLDRNTGKFRHYRYSPTDLASLSDDQVRALYMDHNKDIWIGTRSIFPNDISYPNTGGLNRLDKTTGKFTRFMHDPQNPNTLADNHVRAMYEDKLGNFWVGTAKNGLHLLDRRTGIVKRFFPKNSKGENELKPVIDMGEAYNQVTFITEDGAGWIWFGTLTSGLLKFNPVTHQMVKFNSVSVPELGMKIPTFWRGVRTADGSIWLASFNIPGVLKYDPFKLSIPFSFLKSDANSFCEDRSGNIWIAHSNGLIRRDKVTRQMKQFFGDSIAKSATGRMSPFNSNTVVVIRRDSKDNLWLGKVNGLEVFDPRSEKTIDRFEYKVTGNDGLVDSNINIMNFEDDDHLWIGTVNGLDRMSISERKFRHYKHDENDPKSLSQNNIFCVIKDKESRIWIGTENGLSRYEKDGDQFNNYLKGIKITAIFQDADHQIWVGARSGLFRYNQAKDDFEPFVLEKSVIPVSNVLSIIEDDDHQLWISSTIGIFRVNKERDESIFLGQQLGINVNNFQFADNLKTESGNLLFGYEDGYYEIDPRQTFISLSRPFLQIVDFKVGSKPVLNIIPSLASISSIDSASVTLSHDENIFSIDFTSIEFRYADNISFVYRLKGYDDEWRKTKDHRAYFINVPPGKYTFEVRAFTPAGVYSDKKIQVTIGKPWWQQWWAYVLFAGSIAVVVWGIVQYRSRSLRTEKRVLEERVKERTAEVVKQKEEISVQRDKIEKTYNELKATQEQLVQKEKMASLGELTAGIAHEIQNPLNFVNNFSEVNEELAEELNDEIENGRKESQQSLLKEIRSNNEKISHHGKRADSIVKSMLQHSRTNAGVKEEADLNALADEYMRLAYHGHRAKDKTFNAALETDFDPGANKVHIIPQEIGRVLLNLFNNAFYAVAERKKQEHSYSPMVKVSTRVNGSNVFITVYDNGIGMTDQVKAKIFQPFFTTKPTGQGTGLGMSLSYDIITKGHHGELDVKSSPGSGSEFTIRIPV